MRELASNWYAILSSMNAAVAGPVREAAFGTDLTLISALLFGLIGATSPCQITTGLSAMAFVAGRARDRAAVTRHVAAYILGKALVYTLIGSAVVLAGQQIARDSIPLIGLVRKATGPAMILLGLHLLGLMPMSLSLSLGGRLSAGLERRAGAGAAGAFLLGAAFAFAFCPTLFLLFFGLTLPLAVASPLGVLHPAVFALGTALPLALAAGLLTAGRGKEALRGGFTKGPGRHLRTASAWILLLAGVSDTLTYWFL